MPNMLLILEKSKQPHVSGNEDAKIAVNKFISNIAQYIARYAAVMGGVDAVVFTGGIGENQSNIRSAVCNRLGFMGISLDESKNEGLRDTGIISKNDAKVKVYVIPTDEELMIARDTVELTTK